MTHAPITRRVLLEVVLLLVVYHLGLFLLARGPYLEVLLAPGGLSAGEEAGQLAIAAVCFLLFRIFILVGLPGYMLARWYLLASAQPPASANGPGEGRGEGCPGAEPVVE